jgi:hypothetical protein
MKNKKVCEGCIYLTGRHFHYQLRGTCSYLHETGHSRLMVERANGGYKTDSCICYRRAKK